PASRTVAGQGRGRAHVDRGRLILTAGEFFQHKLYDGLPRPSILHDGENHGGENYGVENSDGLGGPSTG
ncbi:MAG TPA: hypothetical protein VMX74_07520, partial [Pirellulales bacterium]|nr:hypothetical protein [Pirellulales bacterium]